MRFELPEDFAVDRPTTPFSEIPHAANVAAARADFPFALGEVDDHAERLRRMPARYFRQVAEARARGREFAERVLRPAALAVEDRVGREPGYFAWDVMREACRSRMLSLMIPEALGGSGYLTLPMAVLIEELAAGCAGLASTIGVHNVACGLIPDGYLLKRYVAEVVDGERRGEPLLWSGAITEPAAGTDIWDEEFLARGSICTIARPCAGGFVLNGRKCFISNGNVSRYTLLAAATDPKNIPGTWSLFVVPAGTAGFSVGRVERKMGQKGSPAAELILEDAFVPAEMQVMRTGECRRLVSVYLAGSRGPVGAIGVGCARRALECLVDWASQKHDRRGRLIDQQWLQMRVAAMTREIYAGRQAYVAAALAFDEIMSGLYRRPLVRGMLGLLPRPLAVSAIGRRLLQSAPIKALIWRYLTSAAPGDVLNHAAALAAIAKIMGSDAGVNVSGEAARIMGRDAFDPRWPVDKCFRDAKLTQIYEGTNQANAITQFKAMAGNWQKFHPGVAAEHAAAAAGRLASEPEAQRVVSRQPNGSAAAHESEDSHVVWH